MFFVQGQIKLYRLIISVITVLSLSFLARPAISAPDATNNVIFWNNAALQAIDDSGLPPAPHDARSLALLHTAIFDAWAAYDLVAVGTQFGGAFRQPLGEHTLKDKNKAISFAAYGTLLDLFPSQENKFKNLIISLGYDLKELTSTDTTTPAGIGNAIAQALVNYRRNDGSNQLGNLDGSGIPYSDYSGYEPVNTPDLIKDPNRWQPLRVSDGNGGLIEQKFFEPNFALVTPFALTSNSQLLPPPPKTLNSDPVGFQKQAQQILDYSAHLTDRQKASAEFWAKRIPAIQWNLFAQFISKRDNHSVDDDAKMFFILENALFDAGIASWNAKLTYDSERPITAIHYLFHGQKVLFLIKAPSESTVKIGSLTCLRSPSLNTRRDIAASALQLPRS